MFKKKEWTFTGKSGEIYTFEISPKSVPLPETGGIFILAYTHPRGHLSGFQVNTLAIGETDNLLLAVADNKRQDCLKDACWNSNFILRLDDSNESGIPYRPTPKLPYSLLRNN